MDNVFRAGVLRAGKARRSRSGRWALVALVFIAASCRSDVGTQRAGNTPAVDAQPPTAQAPTAESTVASTGGLEPGNHTFALRHDRRERRYIVHVPPGLREPAPVMMALHGGGGNGADFQNENGLDAVADRHGFVAVYPEGSGVLPNRLHTWNSGDSCCGFALDRDIDDVGFLRSVLDDLATRTNIDSGRIYVTGHSNGAMMAYRFAAEAPELVTAIVPVGGAPDIVAESLTPSVAVLHIHSLDDPRAIYEGGEGPPFPGTERTVNHEPVLAGVQDWAVLNECGAEPSLGPVTAGTGANEGQTVMTLEWTGCAMGGQVSHMVLTGTGHGWPGTEVGPFWQERLGPPTTLVDASEEAWLFASGFER